MCLDLDLALLEPGAGNGTDYNAFLKNDRCHSGRFHQADQ